MTAKDIISPKLLALKPAELAVATPKVAASASLAVVLHKMLDTASAVGVVDDATDKAIGTIDAEGIVASMAQMFPVVDESCELIVECDSHNYSASVVARAVEDCNAHILNLNVMERTTSDKRIAIALRINHSHGEAVARSLARYGYDVVDIVGSNDPISANTQERINELIHYLEL